MAWDSYKLLDDPAIRAMLPKVNCVHDDEIEAEFPTNMSGRITIRARGREFSRKVIIPLGEPANFLSEDALLAKFEGLVDRKSVVEGKSVSVRVDLGGRRIL